MRNLGLDEAPAGIKTARRNINNLRYADDTPPYGRKLRTEPLDESERGATAEETLLGVSNFQTAPS